MYTAFTLYCYCTSLCRLPIRCLECYVMLLSSVRIHAVVCNTLHIYTCTYTLCSYMYLCTGDNTTVVYLEEVPIQSLPTIKGKDICRCVYATSHNDYNHMITTLYFSLLFSEMTGHDPGRLILWNFEYGPGYSGAGWVMGRYREGHVWTCVYVYITVVYTYITEFE